MEIPILREVAIIFGLSIVVLYISHRFRLPTIIGYLLTGVVVGPYGLGLVHDVHSVELLAEVGVVLLLFTIGIEFSFKDLARIKKTVLLGGSMQVILTCVAALGIAMLLGLAPANSVFVGFLVALSSTAIVLTLLQERGEIEAPHGQATLGILIFQDIIIVPMMLITPLLAGGMENLTETILLLLLKGTLIVGLVIFGARTIVPRLLERIVRTRERELFLLAVCGIGIGVAWGTSLAGLSLGLGAFLAGLIISESEYSHHALGGILPFRDVFTSFFFVSIGMLFDLSFLLREPLLIAGLTLGALLLKFLIVVLVAGLLQLHLRTAIMLGFTLSQIGEFSFILAKTGLSHELLTADHYQLFLAVSVLTMASTPFLIAIAPRAAAKHERLPLPKNLLRRFQGASNSEQAEGQAGGGLNDHLVIIGYGVNGELLVRAAESATIPFAVIEMNTDTVKREQSRGLPIFYGDASSSEILHQVHIDHARVAVVAISDASATRRIAVQVKKMNPAVYLLVRTRFVSEVEPLYALGADEVIPAEFETAVEIFARVLAQYLVPHNEIEQFTDEIRADGYQMFRSLSHKSASGSHLQRYLSKLEIRTLRIAGEAAAIGQSLLELDLRKKYATTVLAVNHKESGLQQPDPQLRFAAGDIVVIMADAEHIARGATLFSDPQS